MTSNTRSRVTYFIIYITVLLIACTQKVYPEITSRERPMSKKQNTPVTISPDLDLGKSIFFNRCGKCHDLPLPDQYTAKRWEGILSYMIPRARLDTVQGLHVAAYLKENAAK